MDERDYPPIDCHCGNCEEERRNVYMEDYFVVEYMSYCKNCGKYLGHFAYGTWDY